MVAVAHAQPGAVPSAPVGAAAQAYPLRPVRIVIPYPPSGGNDIVARAYADELTRRLGQQVVIDNRPGGMTIIGTELVAKSPADGYTLLVSSHSTFAIIPNINTKLPYDVQRDFAPVALLAIQPFALAVHPSLSVHNIRQLIALARAQPGALTYATSGIGTGGHFCGELLKTMTGINLRHIPYKGGGPALTDVVGGHVSMIVTSLSAERPFIQAKRLRLIAVTSAQRTRLAPEAPTMAESGVTGYEMRGWNAMMAPRGTPPAIIARLNTEVVAMVKSPEARERLDAQGYEPEASSQRQLAELIQSELARYATLVKLTGLKAD